MNLFNHLKTIHTHRKEVRRLCFKCGLYKQGLLHDLSKYSPTELIPSVKYWTGKNSPIENQIKDIGHSEIWLHHKGRNKHHYEYWIDPSHGDKEILCDMPYKYIVEMFCDRVAACKTYLKDKYTDSSPLEYALSKQEKERKLMSTNTYNTLMDLFDDLYLSGEEYVVSEIKKNLKHKN